MTNIPCLGQALGFLMRAECNEAFTHNDVDVMGAPSECHALVAKGESRRRRRARQRAEAVSGRRERLLWKEARKRIGQNADKVLERAMDRIYANHFPF